MFYLKKEPQKINLMDVGFNHRITQRYVITEKRQLRYPTLIFLENRGYEYSKQVERAINPRVVYFGPSKVNLHLSIPWTEIRRYGKLSTRLIPRILSRDLNSFMIKVHHPMNSTYTKRIRDDSRGVYEGISSTFNFLWERKIISKEPKSTLIRHKEYETKKIVLLPSETITLLTSLNSQVIQSTMEWPIVIPLKMSNPNENRIQPATAKDSGTQRVTIYQKLIVPVYHHLIRQKTMKQALELIQAKIPMKKHLELTQDKIPKIDQSATKEQMIYQQNFSVYLNNHSKRNIKFQNKLSFTTLYASKEWELMKLKFELIRVDTLNSNLPRLMANSVSKMSMVELINRKPVANPRGLPQTESPDIKSFRGVPSSFVHAPAMDLAKTFKDSIQPHTQTSKNMAETETINSLYSSSQLPKVDLNRLTDQVYQAIERKIRIERERRGL